MKTLNIPPPGMIPPPKITDYFQAPALAMRPVVDGGKSFQETLAETLNGTQGSNVKFSSHAQDRLQTRGVKLETQDLKQLDQAIDMAKDKGSHNSLILMKNMAFVVNVDRRTVVTAMNELPSQGGIFTNIDSTIMMS